jgi:hypothetical protein
MRVSKPRKLKLEYMYMYVCVCVDIFKGKQPVSRIQRQLESVSVLVIKLI